MADLSSRDILRLRKSMMSVGADGFFRSFRYLLRAKVPFGTFLLMRFDPGKSPVLLRLLRERIEASLPRDERAKGSGARRIGVEDQGAQPLTEVDVDAEFARGAIREREPGLGRAGHVRYGHPQEIAQLEPSEPPEVDAARTREHGTGQ